MDRQLVCVRIVDSEEFHTGQSDQRQMRDLTYTHCPHGCALAVLPGFLFRFTCCGIFGVAIASKAAKNCASLKGFDRVAATFLGANGRSVQPEVTTTRTPWSRNRSIKPSERSPPRRLMSTRAASGRFLEIRRSASAALATGPMTSARQAWSKLVMASPRLNESSTKRMRTPFKSGHPASGGS